MSCRIIWLPGALLLAALLIIGCNGDATPEDDSSPSPTAGPTVTPDGLSDGLDFTPGPDDSESLTSVEIVDTLTPSVVQIVTLQSGLGGFLGQPEPRSGVGTGVIIDDEAGYILTNNHVVEGAEEIDVILNDGETYPGEMIGGDPSTDTAVVQIEAEDLEEAGLGDSSELRAGEDVIAIGHALGLAGSATVSKGVVSALDRSIEVNPQVTIIGLIQTDAAINPGNSGGPLVNGSAQVVGINTAIIPGSEGIGFAVNINNAREVAEQLIVDGQVERGFMGISPLDIPPGAGAQLGVPVNQGVFVARIVSDSPAAEAGIQVEDVIVEMDDTQIRNTGDMYAFLMEHTAGAEVEVTFYRGNEEMQVELTLAESP